MKLYIQVLVVCCLVALTVQRKDCTIITCMRVMLTCKRNKAVYNQPLSQCCTPWKDCLDTCKLPPKPCAFAPPKRGSWNKRMDSYMDTEPLEYPYL